MGEDQFACHSGSPKCIYDYWECDYYIDCADGSDEQNCGDHSGNDHSGYDHSGQDHSGHHHSGHGHGGHGGHDHSGHDHSGYDHSGTGGYYPYSGTGGYYPYSGYGSGSGFTCSSGETIPPSWECDKYPDCDDASDEAHCSCDPSDFICKSGNVPCTHSYWECDGWDDCTDGSDEEHCEYSGSGYYYYYYKKGMSKKEFAEKGLDKKGLNKKRMTEKRVSNILLKLLEKVGKEQAKRDGSEPTWNQPLDTDPPPYCKVHWTL